MNEYYMFHKPRGCITARRDPRKKTVMDYFPEDKRDVIFPVGRLDKETEGFLVLTNDGAFCHKLMMPESEIAKTYFFWVLGTIEKDKLCEIENGVKIYKGREFVTSPAKVSIESTAALASIRHLLSEEDFKLSQRKESLAVTSGYVRITEGKKHQVRRMLAYAGTRVVYLKRVKIGELSLDEKLKAGEYRALARFELEQILLKAPLGLF